MFSESARPECIGFIRSQAVGVPLRVTIRAIIRMYYRGLNDYLLFWGIPYYIIIVQWAPTPYSDYSGPCNPCIQERARRVLGHYSLVSCVT